MIRVILESPFAGTSPNRIIKWLQQRRNINYARRCVKDSLSRDEAPIASHLLYTQKHILNDNVEKERNWGIQAGLAWKSVSHKQVFYIDHGMSRGMLYAERYAQEHSITTEYRSIIQRLRVHRQSKFKKGSQGRKWKW